MNKISAKSFSLGLLKEQVNNLQSKQTGKCWKKLRNETQVSEHSITLGNIDLSKFRCKDFRTKKSFKAWVMFEQYAGVCQTAH